jgi:pimeloyl-ACP methyl ester carboxylesterase
MSHRNLVLIPGLCGSYLTAFYPGGRKRLLWNPPLELTRGGMAMLGIDAAGRDVVPEGVEIRPTGVLELVYSRAVQMLQRSWNLLVFPYDFRRDLRQTARELERQTRERFGGQPFHMAAHSMGGMVARSYIQQNRAEWERGGGRLLMFGVPNHGTFLTHTTVDVILQLARIPALRAAFEAALTWPSWYQLNPSPEWDARAASRFQADAWRNPLIVQARLDDGRRFQEEIADVVDPSRMAYVSGSGFPTVDQPIDITSLRSWINGLTLAGDLVVSHRAGILDGVPVHMVESNHIALLSNDKVLESFDRLMLTGEMGCARVIPSRRANHGASQR